MPWQGWEEMFCTCLSEEAASADYLHLQAVRQHLEEKRQAALQRQQRGLEYSGTRVSTYPSTYPSTGKGNEGREKAMVLVRESEQPRLLSPQPSQALRNHSPDGFEWGYAGSGPPKRITPNQTSAF